MSEQSRACFGQSGGQLVCVFVFPFSSSTNTIQWSAPQLHSWSMAFGTLYIRSHFRHFTGVVPLRSKPDVVSLGRSARRDIESRLHMTTHYYCDGCCYR